MKVEQVGINRNINTIENRGNKQKSSFNDSFNLENRFKSKEEIELYMKEIKSIGEKVVANQNYSDVVNYKRAIKSYLKSVVDYMYSLNQDSSFWDGNYFKTVRIVDEKLESITKELLYDQKDNIDLATKIDEINGLLVDMYL
ncbi:YaaR family protein [Terrisporobacter petrolearius]|uniref:YaaR family protein n=1 Tax=Terrisporobacter petrolearius TaxID=1460447 RepID=UPI001D1690C7|nr:YaaR family protein [Terrisporobacter petrolearius]MCC3862822.1 YaaR family protein [Terrisporobacter petrolearius]